MWSVRVCRRASEALKRVGMMFGRGSGNTGGTVDLESIPLPRNNPGILSDTVDIVASPNPMLSPKSTDGSRRNHGMSPAKLRFRNIVRSAIMVYRLKELGNQARANALTSDQKPIKAPPRPKGSRVAGLIPKLRDMGPTQNFSAHTALVRHMQVSGQPALAATPRLVTDGAPSFLRMEIS